MIRPVAWIVVLAATLSASAAHAPPPPSPPPDWRAALEGRLAKVTPEQCRREMHAYAVMKDGPVKSAQAGLDRACHEWEQRNWESLAAPPKAPSRP